MSLTSCSLTSPHQGNFQVVQVTPVTSDQSLRVPSFSDATAEARDRLRLLRPFVLCHPDRENDVLREGYICNAIINSPFYINM